MIGQTFRALSEKTERGRICVMKTCVKCGIEKTLDSFHRKADMKDGLDARCKDCKRSYHKNWRDENADRQSRYQRDWRCENIDEIRRYKSQWRMANPGKVLADKARRRATKINATPSWLTAIHKAQIQEFYEIAAAKSMQTGIAHSVDHTHPLQGNDVRGLHVPWNLQILTASENSAKCNRLP